jgi:TonB family protein
VPEKPKIKINTLKTTSVKGGETEAANTHTVGSTNGVPQGTTTAAAATPVPVQTAAPAPPTPEPTKPPSCANPNVEATTTNAVAPDTPPIAQQQGITGVVNVVIELDANSKIVGTPTIQSSPSQLLNAAAIKAAEESTFRTEIKNCQPVASKYLFAVEFNNN